MDTRQVQIEHNLIATIVEQAKTWPERMALCVPGDDGSEQQVTFAELVERAANMQATLVARGWRAGDRAIVMAPVSVDLYALVIALAASGMVTVLIDPGMGLGNILWAARHCGARALFSVPSITRFRHLLPPLRKLEVITMGDAWLSKRAAGGLRIEPVQTSSRALVTFTSGSTGRPKGADRTHRVLRAQHEALKAHFPNHTFARPVDCTCFPVVAFHNLASGTSTALPPIDLRRPAELDPRKVADYLRRHRVTSLSGAPAFMEGLCDHLIARGDVLEDIARVLVGGGPVSAALARKVLQSFPNARDEAWGVYGSTEAEPIAHVAMTHMIENENTREGFLVGHPVEEAEVRLLGPTKGVIETDTMEALEALAITTPGEVGEIVVAGAHVVPRYLDDLRADALNKLYPAESEVWHRTGDTGQWDENGELWLTGRVADLVWHRGEMLEPFTLEQQLDGWPEIERCALVSLDATDEERLFLAVVPKDWERWEALEDRLAVWLTEQALDAILPLRIPSMPVDRRHQTKLDRPTLRRFLMLYRHLLPPLS